MPRNAVAYEWSDEARRTAEAADDHKIPPGAYYFMFQLEARAGVFEEC